MLSLLVSYVHLQDAGNGPAMGRLSCVVCYLVCVRYMQLWSIERLLFNSRYQTESTELVKKSRLKCMFNAKHIETYESPMWVFQSRQILIIYLGGFGSCLVVFSQALLCKCDILGSLHIVCQVWSPKVGHTITLTGEKCEQTRTECYAHDDFSGL